MQRPSDTEENSRGVEKPAGPEVERSRSLTASAKSAVIWAGGADLLRDVAQFAAALVLVRLISKEEYGAYAVSQAIVGLLAYLGVDILSEQALQERDPASVDWGTHFTLGLGFNLALFILVELVVVFLAGTTRFHPVAMPLAVTGGLLLITIPGTLALRRLEVEHRWKELRTLTVVGTYLSLSVQVAVAWCGQGLLALALGPVISPLPQAVYFFTGARLRPHLRVDSQGIRKILRFGRYRIGSASILRMWALARELMITASLGIGVVGLVNRASGLGLLTVNRVVTASMSAVYPILTRFHIGSPELQRASAVLMKAALWFLIPSATFVVIHSEEIVLVAYGVKWVEVIPFIPAAVTGVSLVTVGQVLSSVVLANDDVKSLFLNDLLRGVGQVVVAVVVVPYGVIPFLWASAAWHLIVVGVLTRILFNSCCMTWTDLRSALLGPVMAAVAGAVVTTTTAPSMIAESTAGKVAALLALGSMFGLTYVICLRTLFRSDMTSLLEVIPFGGRIRSLLRC